MRRLGKKICRFPIENALRGPGRKYNPATRIGVSLFYMKAALHFYGTHRQ
jgi:hypothetical protein